MYSVLSIKVFKKIRLSGAGFSCGGSGYCTGQGEVTAARSLHDYK